MLLELFIIFPARQHFRNRWEIEQGSPIMKELREIKEEIKDVRQENKDIKKEIKEIKDIF
jgi:hypothetical protein